MSMCLTVSDFKIQGENLDSNYSELSREVNVTGYLDSLLSEKYISLFSAYEEDEELEYREISKENVSILSEEIDKLTDDLFDELNSTAGRSKREEIVSKLRDITLLNQLIKVFLLRGGLASSSNIKLLIS
ncbi:hypothetical protein CBX96_15765 [Shewanella sp. BC20]|uniref:hypothetical protein n=1 Tax=Shewanella sp. BC20 TaxID=2004459 RepID=UPI000D64C2F4|nr:hypothetical protein [Shewanella sp. BC20]PWF62544.1 hypothetical protein CBX96_15765 [Shewanella sp. BC20]